MSNRFTITLLENRIKQNHEMIDSNIKLLETLQDEMDELNGTNARLRDNNVDMINVLGTIANAP